MTRMAMLSVAVFLVVAEVVLGSGYENQGYGQQQKQFASYHHEQSYGYKKPSKFCYQCAYSPPKTYYDKKVVVENYEYGQKKVGYQQSGGYGDDKHQGYGQKGGYTKKSYVPVARTVYGGWDKCFGSFDHYQAKDFGIDVWECHSNCYVRKDPNGDLFRGCYKGEYAVDPNKLGCNYQAGALWCFCKGDKCNNDGIGNNY